MNDIRTRGGRGGQWRNADVLRIQYFYQNSRSLFSALCVKRQHPTHLLIINSIKEVAESFVVDITVIDLMSIVHVDKIF